MNLPRFTRTFACSVLAVAVIHIVCAAGVTAQDTSQTTAKQGTPEQQVTVQRGEVVYVSGNDLVVRNLDTGQVKTFVVPDSARVTVDGQQLSVHDLKPGMKLQRTITTTTTPKTVTTVRTIEGKIWQLNAPISVILTLPDGTNKQYHIPKDQKFMVNGQEVDAFHLQVGMNVKATVITTAPQTEVAETRSVTGEMPAPPPTPPIEGALLIEEPAPPQAAAPEAAAPTVAAAQPAPKLPQTGSVLPLMGLLGALLSGVGVAGYLRRP